jgi:hypothetical protein
MKFRLVLAAFGLVLVIAACGPAPQIRSDRFLQDNSLVTGDPCGAPCWRGIVPGETSWSDALIVLEDDASLNNIQTRADEESGRLGAAWAQADGDGCCQMFSEDGSTVSFIILQTTPDLRLEQVIEAHGNPDYAVAEVFPNDNEQGIFSLFYLDIPMLLYVFVAGEEGSLAPTSEIVGFAYMTDELMEFLIDTSNLHSWQGYQSYGAYMEGEFDVTPAITLTPEGE